MRRAARVDANQAELVKLARSVGASVQSLAPIGRGCPDLLIGYQRGGCPHCDGRVNLLVEVKDGSRPPSERVLTPDEAEWHATWRGRVAVIESPEQMLALLGLKA